LGVGGCAIRWVALSFCPCGKRTEEEEEEEEEEEHFT
jgi:hypothetical protein